ncbi:purple acid phosphatase family protein [Paraglaciecola hydrolytica]|uniref:acid phosphatase n=1 Tax=Paraglaciecola hydrolytica TaxID=1799789 RepID=A0A136A3L9_9ALTE|nr:tartrate-resistant acid phosphatase type 5 family protein [Paraglaciecola hydrolytica]KXI29819.1 acid phosphatase [Paraglaciecola hydrolytica]
MFSTHLWLKISLVICLTLNFSQSLAQEIYDETYYQNHQIQQLTIPDKSLNFLVLGDWGRNGHYQQRPVAKWMDVAMMQLDGEFIVTTGDNFYSNGVASVDDPYWQSSYETIYNGPHLFEDWYVTLGNHDYRGNWQAQIDYSNISRRWNMPNQYYAKTFAIDDKSSVLMIFLDTNPLNPDYKNEAKYAETQKQDGAKQLAWLEHKLATTKASWTIVIGHHPLYSSGKRYGTTDGIRGVLEPILEKYKVDAYYAGHEHDLQHNQPQGTTVAHYVSGAGSEVRPVAQREFTRFAKSEAGFAAVSVTKNALLTQFINASGQVIYQHQIARNKK